MTIDAYINPDFGWPERIVFFIAAFLGVAICVILITAAAKVTSGDTPFYERAHNRVQRFYELIISGVSVMSFACSYVILNHIYSLTEGQSTTFTYMWENWKDFILLLLICLSCVINTLLDKFIIPLKLISKEEKASVRMLSMFYVIIILIYLNTIGDESEYSPVMMYYLGLMIGRFVYFDASFADFIDALKNLFGNLLLLILGLALTWALSSYGFNAGFLLERNYFIVGIFYSLIFMLIAVFIIHHTHILSLFVRKPKEEKTPSRRRRRRRQDYEEEDYIDDIDSRHQDEYDRYAADGTYDDPDPDQEYDPDFEFLDYEEYDNEEEY